MSDSKETSSNTPVCSRLIDNTFACQIQNEKSVPCHECYKDFSDMLHHLQKSHTISLNESIDYCQACSEIFTDELEGVHHYLKHALAYETTIVGNFQKAPEEKMKPAYNRIRHLKTFFLNYICFGYDTLPEEEEEDEEISSIWNILTENCKTEEEEDKEISFILENISDHKIGKINIERDPITNLSHSSV